MLCQLPDTVPDVASRRPLMAEKKTDNPMWIVVIYSDVVSYACLLILFYFIFARFPKAFYKCLRDRFDITINCSLSRQRSI